MRILIGYDGSDGAKDAVELARMLARFEGVEATLAYVAGSGWSATSSYEEVPAEEQRSVAGLLADDAEAFGSETKTRVYLGGSPAHVLTELAEREGVDLLVVGSPHRGPLGRALIGSVAERLLHGATCATVVAPRGFAAEHHRPPALVGVAYDGGSESKIALRMGAELAREAGVGLRVLYVEEPLVAMPGVVAYTPPRAPDPREVLEEATRSVDREVVVEGERLAGPVASALAKACEDGVDFLGVGSRGYGPLGRVLLGSVSTALLRKAPCPVLVAPRAAEEAVEAIRTTKKANATPLPQAG